MTELAPQISSADLNDKSKASFFHRADIYHLVNLKFIRNFLAHMRNCRLAEKNVK